ncbi:MAG TPA: hypothetical protein VEC58_04730 [Roseiarcus sp.]|nr:hypothetical protein [Roseiarcus sp.]
MTGCYTPQGQNAAGGAVLGGATDAAGPYPRPYARCAQWAYDYYGRPFCTAYY